MSENILREIRFFEQPPPVTRVIVGLDGISFFKSIGVLVPTMQSWSFDFKNANQSILKIFNQETSLHAQEIYIFSPWTVLIPNRMSDGDWEPYFTEIAERTLFYSYLSTQFEGMTVVTGVSINLDAFSTKKYCLIQELIKKWSQSASNVKKSIFLYVRKEFITIGGFQDEKICYLNSFAYNNSSDALYYVLLVYELLKFNPQSDPIVLCGHLMRDSEIYRYLSRFIRDIKFYSSPTPLAENEHLYVEFI
jgi:hypothetical protein